MWFFLLNFSTFRNAQTARIVESAQNQYTMYQNTTQLRVRYAETDQMGIVYYGIYPQYFEVGRVEALRELGLTYKKMEDQGTMLPVKNLEVNYHKSALYDDLLTVKTTIEEMPGVKVIFHHKVFNEKDELLTSGKVVLVFVAAETMRPKKAPQYFIDIIKPYFS